MDLVLNALRYLNELLSAGITITSFSLLLYALTFNLRDRVARSFALVLICFTIIYAAETIAGVAPSHNLREFWFQLQWVGIVFLPAAYVHFSDALLSTTGRPSRGRRRRIIRLTYLFSITFMLALPSHLLVGRLVENVGPAPYLQRTWFTWVFVLFFLLVMGWAWVNFYRAFRRTVTRTSRRRMTYLMIGALAPALGSYPFLLFGAGFATQHPLFFWVAAVSSNLVISLLLIIMAYAVAFFGVPWPDRVVKRRLFKWLMRGPVTASTVLAVTTSTKRFYELFFGIEDPAVVTIVSVASLLILEHAITLVAPVWERLLFHGGDRRDVQMIQMLEERLLTSGDLREFLESVLAAVCDRLQVSRAFVVALGESGLEMLLTVGDDNPFEQENPSALLEVVSQNGTGGVKFTPHQRLFSWKDYWLVPLYTRDNGEAMLGLLGAARSPAGPPDEEQIDALMLLAQRAAIALEDRMYQTQLFTSLEALTPQVDLLQRLRAASRYDGTELLTTPDFSLEQRDLARWVKDALTHYWGGPKLSQSPLLHLAVVQRDLETHEGNPTNALRAILHEAIERVRPEGERRFTGEWLLYNILEMKFLEGKKVREIANRLALSEADLYRKQRVAIEAVAKTMLGMEEQAREEQNERTNKK